MSDTWQLLALGDSLELLIDNRGKNPPYSESGVPCVSGMVVTNRGLDFSKARFVDEETWAKWMPEPLRKNDVVMTSEAPLGRPALIRTDEPIALTQRVFGLRGKEGVLDSRFLYYSLFTNQVRADLLGRATGTTVVGIRQPALKSVKIPAPSFVEQVAIAKVLGALDDKIAANTKLAETLAEMATAHFDVAEKTCGEAIPLSEVVTTQYGATTSSHQGPGPRFLRVTDINKKPWIEWDTTPFCTVSDADWEKYKVKAGDILVARMADPGKAAFIDPGDPEAVFASYLVRLKAINPEHALFIYYFLRSAKYRNYAEGAMQGSVQKNMNAKVIVTTDISIPDINVLRDFNSAITNIRAQIQGTLKENRQLAAMRDALLPQLMSGKLRVKDAEKVLEESL